MAARKPPGRPPKPPLDRAPIAADQPFAVADPGREKGRHFSAEQVEVFIREIEDRMFGRGQHPAKVVREMAQRYECSEQTAQKWLANARERWRLLTSKDDLTDRQNQLERMAHELYERAIGDYDRDELCKLVDALELGWRSHNTEKMRVALEGLRQLSMRQKPNMKIAVQVLANLGRFYGLGQTIKLDVPGLNFGDGAKGNGKGK